MTHSESGESGAATVRRDFSRSAVPESELSETACPICGKEERKFLAEERGFPVVKCRRCGHVYVSLRPSEAWLRNFYTSATYMPQTTDETRWEEPLNDIYDATARAIVRFHPRRGDLLDVGAGCGGFLLRAASDGWRLHGVEPHQGAFAVAQKRLGGKAHLQHATFDEADLAASSFD